MICFLQLRDIALKRFQLAELDDLPSAVFISAFLATAGKTVTELSLFKCMLHTCTVNTHQLQGIIDILQLSVLCFLIRGLHNRNKIE